ncbi:uncharacterized protein LOC133926145 isoform X2 [Phragmites australis]|uniref:uncharacterized protein LOC133926145 isoform X2 n=1 Tax=Phragmites australis TaxID=29695 RepID=UPI002D7A0F3C|nr:uncharacterized protein LOC133926145 isoform X2 [Phragmites australis]
MCQGKRESTNGIISPMDILALSVMHYHAMQSTCANKDVLHHIHSLVPLRDAARAACVSRSFLRSWRRFPNLTFSWETLGLHMNEGERAMKLRNIIHHILENHCGTGVKTVKFLVRPCLNAITANDLDIWLEAAVKSGIEELAVDLPQDHGLEYSFSCLLLSCAARSLQSFSLSYCAFHPTLIIGCLKNLRSVCLRLVHITEEELGCFFSCTISLEKLEVSQCNEITLLKIPSHLQQLSILRVFLCRRLQMIQIYAPKVTTFSFGGPPTRISIRNSPQLKTMAMDGLCYSRMFEFALTRINHSIASNLQTLILSSSSEATNMPASSAKFLHLRHLKICCCGFLRIDFFSLISFLKASPALETFFLSAGKPFDLRQDSILEDSNADSSHLRRIPEFHHDNLKKVSITGFCSAKSLIELTCQILENSSSLQCLVLDTTNGYNNTGICGYMEKKAVMEALRGVEAIKKYVNGKIPSGVKFVVLEPCDRCHIPKL